MPPPLEIYDDLCSILLYSDAAIAEAPQVMVDKRRRKPTGQPRATRASASLPPGIYSTLQDTAKQKKVSVAWVIRDAAEK